jgi:hypothetical protein
MLDRCSKKQGRFFEEFGFIGCSHKKGMFVLFIACGVLVHYFGIEFFEVIDAVPKVKIASVKSESVIIITHLVLQAYVLVFERLLLYLYPSPRRKGFLR